MTEESDKEDKNFNPMHIEYFYNEVTCRRLGAPQLYELAKSNFKQQNLPAWRPVPTLCYSIGMFVFIALLSFILGISLVCFSVCVGQTAHRLTSN